MKNTLIPLGPLSVLNPWNYHIITSNTLWLMLQNAKDVIC